MNKVSNLGLEDEKNYLKKLDNSKTYTDGSLKYTEIIKFVFIFYNF